MVFVYPSYDAVIDAHNRIIRETGGELGMVSKSNLAYVLQTVKDIGEHLPEKDAALRKAGYLLYNVINLHPFLDGNKRTALELAKNFLSLNGWLFEPQEDDAFSTLMSMARGEASAEIAEQWIGRNLRRARERE